MITRFFTEKNVNSQSVDKILSLLFLLLLPSFVLTQSTWTGNSSSNWTTGANWNGGVPNQNSTVTIPLGTPNSPNVTGVANCAQIVINGTVTVSAGGQLNVFGNFTNNGTFIDNGGVLVMRGNGATVLNTTPMEVTELRIESTGGVTVTGGMVTIKDELQVNKSYLNTGNLITLRSDANGTARIDELNQVCTYRLNMQTTPWFFGLFDFWLGANVTVLENGASVGSFSDAGGGTIVDIPIENGSTITLNYATGISNNSYSYSFLDPSGTTVFSAGPGPAGGNVFTTTATCPFANPITGTISMERYIDAGETYYRYFGSAVEGATIAQFNDDFTTSGYPGSLFPGFSWVSAYNYEETLGPGLGYLECTGANQVMNLGEGWMIWCGDTITGTQPFTFDLVGVPNQGDIDIPVSYTNTGTIVEDGFNLVCNPYPSAIDWEDSDWNRVNVANAIYIQNPDTKQYATYVAGASTNGGSRYISSQQAFWINTVASPATLQMSEGVKADVDPAFIKSTVQSPGMKIKMKRNDQFDEVVVRHVDVADDDYNYDWDAQKYWGGWGEYPQLSLINGQNRDLTVHSFNTGFQEWSIPLRAIVFENGDYTLSFSNVAEMNVPCIQLEDTYSGQTYLIEEGTALDFAMSDTTYAPRYILHIGKNYNVSTTGTNCYTSADGAAELQLGLNDTVYYEIYKNGNTAVDSAFGDPLILSDLTGGNYQIFVPELVNMCNVDTIDFTVYSPADLFVSSNVINETQGNDGQIYIQVSGGTPPYTYQWNNGSTANNLSNLAAGSYTAFITDLNGCTTTETYSVLSVLSLNDEDQKMRMYYNQEEQQIIISGQQLLEESVFALYDSKGQIVSAFNTNGTENMIIQLPNDLAKGIYLLSGLDTGYKLKWSY